MQHSTRLQCQLIFFLIWNIVSNVWTHKSRLRLLMYNVQLHCFNTETLVSLDRTLCFGFSRYKFPTLIRINLKLKNCKKEKYIFWGGGSIYFNFTGFIGQAYKKISELCENDWFLIGTHFPKSASVSPTPAHKIKINILLITWTAPAYSVYELSGEIFKVQR